MGESETGSAPGTVFSGVSGGDYAKADLGKRILAAIIDCLIAVVPMFIPVIGAIAGAAYILTKDAIVYVIGKNEEWKNKSIGKKLMGLKVVELSGQDVDIMVSSKRNITIAIGSILAIIPILGWIAAVMVAPIIGIIECILVLTDPKGRRIGDKIANTQVVND